MALNLPKNQKLPYFAYDSFKLGQIAYPVIDYFVDSIEEIEVDFPLLHRNGIPAIINEHTDKTCGHILYFNNNIIQEKYNGKTFYKNAYSYIAATKPADLYDWIVEPITDELSVNIAVGNPDKFRDVYENYNNYEGEKDPVFYDALKFIEKNIQTRHDPKFCIFEEDYRNRKDPYEMYFDNYLYPSEKFLDLQMNYALLWSSIDKYLSLCYWGWNQKKNIIKLSRYRPFKEGLKKFVSRKDTVNNIILSTRTSELNRNNSANSIKYYYEIRCNVIHGGKEVYQDMEKVLKSLEELSQIFKYILDDTFKSEMKGCEKYCDKLIPKNFSD